ncbi:ABC transporter substrate-binding protein [Chloroflexus islandicus]|uniref:ABC transporter substrate-binding protein n=1 Tax=Chloroflexus islandicus TaxID=1707952 RepID=A0A178MBV5_9CHLR|nr:sugar ABC transporter substrate-binding protein [Chloroflexus islandicus]OAN45498.1 ABC transporter substrate-binding protein [Chloroflexus islandicus]
MRRAFALPLAIITLLSLILSACGSSTANQPAQPQVVTQIVRETQIVQVEKTVEVVVTPTPGPNPEAVISDVEAGAEITFWTFYLSPTFDKYIQDTIARFNEAYPGVKVKWEDRQATLQEEYRNSLAAGNAPDVVNIPTDWVLEFAQKDQLLNMSQALPPAVQAQYFEGLFNQVNVGGASYQVPWYQAVDGYLVNKQILEQAGLTMDDLPKTFDEQKEFCAKVKAATGIPCGLRLNTGNLLQSMAYEGNVTIMDANGRFVFDSPEAVSWLQYYVDMIKDGTTARDILLLNSSDDRIGLERFTSGQMPFYVTGPQLIRLVRESNPGLYGYLAMVPRAVGRSGKLPPVSMSIVVSKNTKYPRAAAALAAFMTNPRSMLEFSKLVQIFPSTPASYDDPFFTQPPVAIEDQVRPIARDIISRQSNILPEIPRLNEVNEIVRQAIEAAVFGGVPAEQALKDAVAQANALIGK